MSARCPEGHLSDSLDYCDVCGSPMGAGGAAPADAGGAGGSALPSGYEVPGASSLDLLEPGGATQAATQICPHCGALNVADALFCEACGYDFTTGTPPMGAETAADAAASEDEDVDHADDDQDAGDADADAGEANAGAGDADDADADDADADDADADDADADDADADDASAPLASVSAPSTATEAGHSPHPVAEGVDPSESEPEAEPEPEPDSGGEPEPEPQPEPKPESEPEAVAAAPAHRKARHTPPSRALAEAWVVELWVDPDWYAVQQTEEACPSAGVPDIVLLTRSAALIGRPSGSLGVQPEVDAGADSAVSRRHAQLTSDGQRWWVEDLGSSNGTFVGTVGEPLPTTPLPPGQRVEVDRDDRLYVGAWTRVVLRQATASERQGTG